MAADMSTDSIAAFLASMAAAGGATGPSPPMSGEGVSPNQLGFRLDGGTGFPVSPVAPGGRPLIDELDFADMGTYFASTQMVPPVPRYDAESGFEVPPPAATGYPYGFGLTWAGAQPIPAGPSSRPSEEIPPDHRDSGSVVAEPGNTSTAPARKRTSKACENCRIRRTKCTGGTPCAACSELGLQSSCLVRQKARPKRALPKLAGPATGHAQSLEDLGFGSGMARDHALFVWGIERRLSHWAGQQGVDLDLSLPKTSRIDSQLSCPLPPLSLLPVEGLLSALECIYGFLNFFDFLNRQRAHDLLRRFQTQPEGLGGDQRALVLACLALGLYRRRELAEGLITIHGDSDDVATSPSKRPEERNEDEWIGNMRYEVLYFRWALKELDQWGSASPTALSALHILHTYALFAGGPGLIQEINGRMAWQCRELQIHRVKSARMWDAKEDVGKLFYATLHKDRQVHQATRMIWKLNDASWMATVTSSPPYFLSTDFDPHFPAILSDARFGGDDAEADGPQVREGEIPVSKGAAALRSHPFLVQLTLVENEILTRLHAEGTFNEAAVLEYEGKLSAFNKTFREDQKKRERPLLQAFAEIRYLWLRIMLRAPLIDHPTLGLSSLSTLARSAPSMLNAYGLLARTRHLHPTWPEVRRITTASHIVFICCIEREMSTAEAEGYLIAAAGLLKMLCKGCDAAAQALQNIERLADLLGMSALASEDFSLGTDEPDIDRLSFDYTLADGPPSV